MPPQSKPLAEVQDKAVAAWQAEQKREKVTESRRKSSPPRSSPTLPLAKVGGRQGADATRLAAADAPSAGGRDRAAGAGRQAVRRQARRVVTGEDATGAYVAQLKEIQRPGNLSAKRSRPQTCAQQLPAQESATIAGDSLPRRCAAASRSRSSSRRGLDPSVLTPSVKVSRHPLPRSGLPQAILSFAQHRRARRFDDRHADLGRARSSPIPGETARPRSAGAGARPP